MKTLILAGFLSACAHNKCTMSELNGACKSCRKCPFTNSNFGCRKYGVTHHPPTKSEKKCLSQDASCGGPKERCYGTKYVCSAGHLRPDGSSEYDVKCVGGAQGVGGYLDYGPPCVPIVKCTASDTARPGTKFCVECTEASHCAGNMQCSDNKCVCKAGLSAAGSECLPECPGTSHCLPSSECVAADGSLRCPCYSVDSNGDDLEIKGSNLCINPCTNKDQASCDSHRWCKWDFTCAKNCVHREESACLLSEGCLWNDDVCLVDDRSNRGSAAATDVSGLMVALIAALLCCLCCACLLCFVRRNKNEDPDAENIYSRSMSSGAYSSNKHVGSVRSKARRRPE